MYLFFALHPRYSGFRLTAKEGEHLARINIEDSLYRDDRFLNLVAKVGNVYMAKGMVLTAFTLAQNYWLKHKSIPIDAWPGDLQALIDCRLAEVCPKGTSVYVKGSSGQFGWLDKSSLGGKSKSEKKTRHLVQNMPKDDLARRSAEAPTPTLTLPLTLSLAQAHTLIKKDIISTTGGLQNEVPEVSVCSVAKVMSPKPPTAPGFFDAVSVEEVLKYLTVSTKKRWVALYPNKDWLLRTVTIAIGWYMDNPKKKPKSVRGWAQALSSWLERDWTKNAKFEKGQTLGAVDWTTVFKKGGIDAAR